MKFSIYPLLICGTFSFLAVWRAATSDDNPDTSSMRRSIVMKQIVESFHSPTEVVQKKKGMESSRARVLAPKSKGVVSKTIASKGSVKATKTPHNTKAPKSSKSSKLSIPSSVPSAVPTLLPTTSPSQDPTHYSTIVELSVQAGFCEGEVDCADGTDSPEGIVNCYDISDFTRYIPFPLTLNEFRFTLEDLFTIPFDLVLEVWIGTEAVGEPDSTVSLSSLESGENTLTWEPPLEITSENVCVKLKSEFGGISFEASFDKSPTEPYIRLVSTCVETPFISLRGIPDRLSSTFCMSISVN